MPHAPGTYVRLNASALDLSEAFRILQVGSDSDPPPCRLTPPTPPPVD